MKKTLPLLLIPLLILGSCGEDTSSTPPAASSDSTSVETTTSVEDSSVADSSVADSSVADSSTESSTSVESIISSTVVDTGFDIENAVWDDSLVSIKGVSKTCVDDVIVLSIETAADAEVRVTSSDTSILTVTPDGIVVGVGVGTAHVVAIATTEDGHIDIATHEVTVEAELPSLRTMMENITEQTNYTVTITKDGAAYHTYSFTDDVVTIQKHATGEVIGYAVGADGYGYSFTVTDGTVAFGERLKDDDGYVTAETFLHDNDMIYSPFPKLHTVDARFFPSAKSADNTYGYTAWTEDEDEDYGYNDRSSMNRYSITTLLDVDKFDRLYNRPRITSLSATVTSYWGLEFDMAAKLRTDTSDSVYHATVEKITTTTIDSAILAQLEGHTSEALAIEDQTFLRGMNLIKGDNYIINGDYANHKVVTDTYWVTTSTDEQVLEAYANGEYYAGAYDTWGYLEANGTTYSFYQSVTTDGVTVTRADQVSVYEYGGTDIKEIFSYPGDLELWDHADSWMPSGNYLSYNYGLATQSKTDCQEAFSYFVDTLGVAEPYGHQLVPYRFVVDFVENPQAYVNFGVVAEADADCVIVLQVWYQDSISVGLTTGANGNYIYFSDFGVASNSVAEAIIAQLSANNS